MVGMAAGLALRGRVPVVHALATFLTLRAFEFIRTDVGIAGLPVKLVGTVPGFLSEANGPTHQAIEDVALMRGIPGMQVVCPADEEELVQALPAVLRSPRPTYLRYVATPARFAHQDYQPGVGRAGGRRARRHAAELRLPGGRDRRRRRAAARGRRPGAGAEPALAGAAGRGGGAAGGVRDPAAGDRRGPLRHRRPVHRSWPSCWCARACRCRCTGWRWRGAGSGRRCWPTCWRSKASPRPTSPPGCAGRWRTCHPQRGHA